VEATTGSSVEDMNESGGEWEWGVGSS